MLLRQRVRSAIGVSSYALRPRDVDKCVITYRMGFLCNGANRFQLRSWIQKALVAALNVVVHLDTEYTVALSLFDDLVRVPAVQSVGADANKMRPIQWGRSGITLRCKEEQRKQQRKNSERA